MWVHGLLLGDKLSYVYSFVYALNEHELQSFCNGNRVDKRFNTLQVKLFALKGL